MTDQHGDLEDANNIKGETKIKVELRVGGLTVLVIDKQKTTSYIWRGVELAKTKEKTSRHSVPLWTGSFLPSIFHYLGTKLKEFLSVLGNNEHCHRQRLKFDDLLRGEKCHSSAMGYSDSWQTSKTMCEN